MQQEAAQLASVIERIAQDILAKLVVLSDEQLNQPLPVPDASPVFAIATHAVGMGEFWVLTLVGDRPSDRNRAAEFQATGQGQALIARYTAWIADVHALLDDLPAPAMDRVVEPPLEFRRTGGLPDGRLTVRDCLHHVVEHTATHLGHIQLSADLLQAGVFSNR
ncbi:MAG: DinB family protein [Caldilineaceae bacterium]|nr:DinB family protein [Caldilineaceae bacterium]